MDCGEANSDHNLMAVIIFLYMGLTDESGNSRIFVKPGSAKLSANLSNPKYSLNKKQD